MIPKKLVIYLVSSLVVISLIIAGATHLYNSGYDAGVNKEKEEQRKAIAEAQKKFDTERLELNKTISELKHSNSELRTSIYERQAETKDKVEAYAKSEDGNSKSLDDEWIRIYNESLGIKK